MAKANILKIVRLRIDGDGEGVRSAVFLYGCPLNCVWCCNPETKKSNQYKNLTTDELYKYIKRDLLYFSSTNGGVTFSGGEPLQQAEFISEFIDKINGKFSVNIETSLYSDLSNIKLLCPLINEWYIDFKVFDENKHLNYTGASNNKIKQNLKFLANTIDKNKIVITYPIIPDYNTDDENLNKMISFLNEIGLKRIKLHPYRKIQEQKHINLGLKPSIIQEVSLTHYKMIREMFLKNGFNVLEHNSISSKKKCVFLKNIRYNFCNENNLPISMKKCVNKYECAGTCPKCEQEIDYINEFLGSD